MKKQLSFLNPKGAGRKPLHDIGIRHIARVPIKKRSAFHLTIKVQRDKAFLKNKLVFKIMHAAIKGARKMGLLILHYTLEFDHIHLLVEANNEEVMGRAMKSFGVVFSKGLNKLRKQKGSVYKTRYHLILLKTPTEIKRVLHYLFQNGQKHKTSSSLLSPYNSFVKLKSTFKLYPGESFPDLTKDIYQQLHSFLSNALDEPKLFIIHKWCV